MRRGGGGIARKRRRGVLVVGITGGIGSGKGLATEFFRRRGAAIIDADEVAHELTRPGEPLTHRIASEFGTEFLREDGSLDRGKLAGAVFEDPAALARLNAITHPPIMDAIGRELGRMGAENETGIVCLVAPLLLEVEGGPAEKVGVDRVVVMVADEEERIARVMARDGLTAEEVKQRIRAQMPEEEQRRRADWVVDTAGGKEKALSKLELVWRELTRG